MKDNYDAEAYLCSGSDTCEKSGLIKGKWTTVYDQALQLELESGQRFIANFRYDAKSSLTADPTTDQGLMFTDIKTSDYGSFDSRCGSTMVGFVQEVGGGSNTMTRSKMTCFTGS